MSERARRAPDFFIAGAPRCGTTALYEYLRRHPQIFMPHTKEPCHLCPDLDSGSEDDAVRFMRDADRYFALFDGIQADRVAGEACVLYLYSTEAPRLITEISPRARIIVMLRDPVEQVYSHHATRRAGGEEDLDFAAALEAEADRAAGRRLPRVARNLRMYQYREVARYSGPLAAYLDHFGTERIRVMLLEEFSADPQAMYRATLEFLGVDPEFRPDFDIVNANRTVGGLIAGAARSTRLITTAKAVVPRRWREPAARLGGRLLRAGSREEPRPPMDPAIRRRLVDEFRPEVDRLSQLLGRDLTAVWPDYAAH
ncbi:MAG TPA: sulfotransferase [Gammaproteobacteria bacterium]|nr:sulfotransferase [Gammaproteobacteria bacterium]